MAKNLTGQSYMSALEFADTNIVVYAVGKESLRQAIARRIVASGVTVSAQVVNETVNVLVRKQGVSLPVAHEVAESLLDLITIVPVGEKTIRGAIQIAKRYQFSHWDSLIVAAALQANCQTLYSEDMQHGQMIEGRLTIINPFD